MWRILHADQRQKHNHKEEPAGPSPRWSLLGETLDWYWTREIFFLRVWGIEESNVSSSSFTTCASRRRWSSSFLENQRKSSESVPTLSSLVWRVDGKYAWQEEEIKEDSSTVLFWCFRNNCLFPSSSRTFRTQSYWSFIAGQFSGRFLQVHLPCRMCNHFTFHHQFRIDTWRSKFEQKTDSILSACGSYGQESQGSWYGRVGSTASCAMPAQSMEEPSRPSILGWHQSCYYERIEILSDSIECNHSSRNTPSLLYPESC